MAVASIVVPFFTAVSIAIIAKIEFTKNKRQIGSVPPGTNLLELLLQQGNEIAELREEIEQLKVGLKKCESREQRLLKRLGIAP